MVYLNACRVDTVLHALMHKRPASCCFTATPVPLCCFTTLNKPSAMV